jgi:hypothetical protein
MMAIIDNTNTGSKNYSFQIETISNELERYIKSTKALYSYNQISEWVDVRLFSNNFVQQNLSLNLLWIFSKQRILQSNEVVNNTCNWLYERLDTHIDTQNHDLINAYVIVAIEKLTKSLKELPSIRSCLTNYERESVKNYLSKLIVDEKVFNFKKSQQYIKLKKIESIPIVSSFLNNYDSLLDIVTGSETQRSLGQVMQYILNVNDVINDSDGLLGLVDDLYALEQLKIDPVEYDFSLKWQFEMNFPDFQFPIIIDKKGNNLINQVDGLIKTALFYSERNNTNKRLFFIDEPGPFSILASILGIIINLKIEQEKNALSNSKILLEERVYKLSKGPLNIIVQFLRTESHGKNKFYLFQTEGNAITIDQKIINDCVVEESDEFLSRESKVNSFKKATKLKVHGMFPFGLANNLSINFEKVLLLDKKINIDIYLNTEIEGRTIEEWFGCKRVNTKLNEKISLGLLSDQPLITVFYSLDSLIKYLLIHKIDQNYFQSLNMILETNLDSNLENLSYLTTSFDKPFKTVNIFSNQKNDYVEKQFSNLGYLVYSEERTINKKFIHPPRDSLFENYLSKVGSYPEVTFLEINEPLIEELFELLNFKLDPAFRKLKGYLYNIKLKLLSRYSLLTYKQKKSLSSQFETYLNKLVSYTHVHENIPKIIDFITNNKLFIQDYEKFTYLNDMKSNHDNEKILVSIKEFETLKRRNWQDGHITKSNLRELRQISNIIVPAFIDARVARNLINFPHAESVCFIATKFEIKNFLIPLLERRDGLKNTNLEVLNLEKESDTKFENIFLDMELDFSSSKFLSSSNSYELYDARIFLFEDNKCLALPLGGRQIISHDLINIFPEEIAVKDIECGNFLICPDTNNGDLQDSILDSIVDNITPIRELSRLWKIELDKFLLVNSRGIEQLLSLLELRGEKRHEVTVKNWFKNPHLLAPKHPEIVFKIFEELLNKNDGYFNKCLMSVQTLYKARTEVLNDLPEYIRNVTFNEDESNIEFKIKEKKFKANLYEALSYQDTTVNLDFLYKVKDMEDFFE